MMFPNQVYLTLIKKKNETYFILSGDLTVNINDEVKNLKPGDTLTIEKNNVHSFKTKNGVVFEEIATTYIKGDSIYSDGDIPTDGRKTIINLD